MLPRLALAALVAGPLMAQWPPPPGQAAWRELKLPQGVVSSALSGQGKLVLYRDGTTLHVFSSLTRSWHHTQASLTATVRLFNDVLVILEPGYCRAFASYTGRFADLAVSPAAAVLNGGNNRNDSIALVADGSQLHAFSGFVGAWTTRSIGAGYAASVQRHVAIVYDGNTLAGMSAFSSSWRERTVATAITSLDTDGTAGLAEDGSMAFAFSAHSETWHEHQLPAAATFVRGDDWGLWHGSGQALGFSAVRGTFTTANLAVTGLWGSSDLFALLATPAGLTAYSAVTATFSPPQSDPVAVDCGLAVAVLEDASAVRGYSPLQQSFVALSQAAASTEVGDVVAYAISGGSGQLHAWSSLSASWHAAPAGVLPGAPALTTTTIGVQTPTDTYAFAPGSGSFVALGGSVGGLLANATSAPLLAFDSTVLAAFDARTERWVETARTGSGTPVSAIWRTTAAVLDGTVVHGIGAQSGQWHSFALPSTNGTLNANSEVGFLELANAVVAGGMLAEITPFAQFPQFRRLQPVDVPVRLNLTLPKNAFAFVAAGPLTGPVGLPGLGTLWFDPTTAPMLAVAPLQTASTTLQWRLGRGPQWLGATLACQALVLPPQGPIFLTELGTVQLW